MLTFYFFAAVITIGVGWGLKWYLEKQNSIYEIDNKEFAIVCIVMLAIVLPGTWYFGRQAAISNQVTYHENWTGWETGVTWQKITCTRDGVCRHCYDCDPYYVDYECGHWEGEGKNRHYVSKTCQEKKYHSCPYTTEEWTFTVQTSIGEDYTIASHNLPTNPDSHRWRWSTSVPSYLPSGVPDFWTAVRNRLATGQPGPVTARKDYENFILASNHSIMKRYSDSVEQFSKAGLLPDVRNGNDLYGLYQLNRVYFVGVNAAGDWATASNRFNAAFGTELQGDLHLIIVDAKKVTNPDAYIGAILAYWQTEKFGKDALSKNGVVIVLGTEDGKTVTWARAGTGMPVGNEELVVQLQYDLKGVNIDPATLLGNPSATVINGTNKVQVTHTAGLLEKILWGDHKFQRVRMKGDDGKSGFAYLLLELEPTFWQKMAILFAALFFAGIGWGATIYHGVRSGRYGR